MLSWKLRQRRQHVSSRTICHSSTLDSLTVMGAVYPSTTKTAITYSDGTITPRLQAGTAYQYAFNPREFWRRGLSVSCKPIVTRQKATILKLFLPLTRQRCFKTYSLTAQATRLCSQLFKVQTLQNSSTKFTTWLLRDSWLIRCTAETKVLVGWKLIAFNGNYWGDDIGLGARKLMVAGTPTRLKPEESWSSSERRRRYIKCQLQLHIHKPMLWCCGLGHMGGPIAAELTAAKYNVVGIEKGPFWDYNTDWRQDNKDDEWAIGVERKFDHPLYISTFTIRNNMNQFAIPVRRYTKTVQYHALGHGSRRRRNSLWRRLRQIFTMVISASYHDNRQIW